MRSLEESAKFCEVQQSFTKFEKLAKFSNYFNLSLEASSSATFLFALDFRMATTCSSVSLRLRTTCIFDYKLEATCSGWPKLGQVDSTSKNNDANYWQHNQNMAAINSWRGIAFENLSMAHINQIKKSLGISGIATTESTLSLRGDETNKGTQIDLVIERKDRVVNLCEIKFYNSQFEIDKDYELVLRNRINLLQTRLKKRDTIHLTLITTFGVKFNKYSGIVQQNITLDDLFQL